MSTDRKGNCVVKNTFLEFFEPAGADAAGAGLSRRGRSKTDGCWVPGMSPAVGPAAKSPTLAPRPKPSPKRLPKASPKKLPAPSPNKLPAPSPCRLPAWPETPMLEAAYEHQAWPQDPALEGFDWMLPACAGEPEVPWMLGEDGMPFDWMMMPGGPYPDAYVPEIEMALGCWDGTGKHPSSASTASGEEASAGSPSAEGGTGAEHCQDWRTTVMLRGLPTDLTRDVLVNMLNDQGFVAYYDLVYLPVDFSTGIGLGYAFVNCTCPSLVNQIWTSFDGRKEWPSESDKVCSVSWSDPHQGLASHIERYQNSPVMHHEVADGWKPALYVHGMRVDFPPPTKRIKAPKVRSKKTAAEPKE